MEHLSYSKENKKLFVSAINDIVEQTKQDDTFSAAVAVVDSMRNGFYYDYDKVLYRLEDILQKVFLPETSEDAVSWFCDELFPLVPLDNKDGNCSAKVNGIETRFLVTTPEDLYEFEWGKYENLKPIIKNTHYA